MARRKKNVKESSNKYAPLTNDNGLTVLTDTAMAEFIALFKKRFHKDISKEEAFARANDLLNLYITIYGDNYSKTK